MMPTDPDPSDLLPHLLARGFVAIEPGPGLAIDIRYATSENFLGEAVYRGFDRLILHPLAAGKLKAAVGYLARRAPTLGLVVFDGLRPNRIQRLMWEAVRGTPQQPYVGDPAIGSIHGYGLAVDVSLQTAGGALLDMGTPFDDFSPRAEPRLEDEYLAAGVLTPDQIANRRLLRATMVEAGFEPIAIEWWHFDALPADIVRRSFPFVE